MNLHKLRAINLFTPVICSIHASKKLLKASIKRLIANDSHKYHSPVTLRCLQTIRYQSTERQCTGDQHERRQSYVHHIGSKPLVYRNVGQHLRIAAERFPNIDAVVSCHESTRLPFSTVLDKVDRLAAAFYQLGLEKGDRVAIWAPNGILFYLANLAAARAGMISVGINPAYQIPELEYSLNKIGARAIIAPEGFRQANYYGMLSHIAPELASSPAGQLVSKAVPSLKSVIIDSAKKLPGVIKFSELFELPGERDIGAIERLQSKISPDAGVNLQFTSGTTGAPKAALMSHFGFVNNGLHIGERNELDRKEHRMCVQVPLFHAYGMVIAIMTSISYGSTVVLPSAGFKAADSLAAIMRERCSVILGTPTMYVDLVRRIVETGAQLETPEIAVTGGATCSPKLFADIKNALGVRKVKTVFGMTETTAVIFQSLFEETPEDVQQTVGHVTNHYEAKVIDKEGHTVPFGVAGELCVRGYGTMLGYWGDEKKTKETIDADRWLRTGDQFVLREDGYGRIVGRLKEVVIRGGENIYPKEVEDFLNTYPKILEAHCVGVPDERLGEELCAFVRLKDPAETIDREELKRFCEGHLAYYKVPRYVRALNDLPKTTSGKVQKFKLVELFTKEQQGGSQ
ncbi:medium-chain acyl-CoA ligase ACSF2, mitochondrial-like isoform X1 [Anopheles albimanus]|uniref:medium-chain acyl-CoA ligase ACSF2, mitochondrial-like isoform X1 n=1 Tax=Anopheles albimanus TaxID=7167 RepID=UPI001640DF1B|nr:medium-chain acyl-CoA ligase ACSF2, mitochondrial-like isoform X1 [Anopheles albimanus]